MTIDKLLFCNMYNILTLAAPDRWRYCTTWFTVWKVTLYYTPTGCRV